MTVDEIKSANSMRDVVGRYGYHPNRAGFISCPFHTGDRSPSMKIYAKDFHCHACGANGDIFSFIQRKDNCDFKTAFYSLGGSYRQQSDGSKLALYYVSDKDKAWYKEQYGIRYSDAYEVYGLERTGCCGCSISARAVEDLEKIRPYEPNVVKAAWNIFGDSYRYRQKYNEFKRKKQLEKKNAGQMSIEDYMET